MKLLVSLLVLMTLVFLGFSGLGMVSVSSNSLSASSPGQPAETSPPDERYSLQTSPPSHQETPGQNDMWDSFKQTAYDTDPICRYYLYRNPDRENGHRLVILIHGGNYLYGSARDYSLIPLAKFFTDRGYSVASIGYRPLTTHHWPTPVYDIRKGIRHLLQAHPTFTDTTYVGYSAGAVTGALLLYSSQFPPLDDIDRYIGISGLYSSHATASTPIRLIREESREGLNILDVIDDIQAPKTKTPALLIEGSQDYFADRFPNTRYSHASTLKRILAENRIYSRIYQARKPGFNDHAGPMGLISIRDPEISREIEAFMTVRK